MDSNMKCEIAKKARAFMSDESKWIRNDYGIDKYGLPLSPYEVKRLNDEVVKVCLIGAYCLFGLFRSQAAELIEPYLPNSITGKWLSPEEFNNNPSTQFSDIIKVMDKVIEGECPNQV